MRKIVSLEEVITMLKKLNGESMPIDMCPYINTVEFLEKMTRHEFDADTEEEIICELCGGAGYDEDDEEEPCENCCGDGVVWEDLSPQEWLEKEFEEGNMKQLDHDNSYNWSAPLSNHIDFIEYLNTRTSEKFIELKVHLYGDVRCNYTDSVWFACGMYPMMEQLMDTGKICTYEIDGQEYDVRIIPTSDMADIYDEDGDHVAEVSVYDLDCENPVEVIMEIVRENM